MLRLGVPLVFVLIWSTGFIVAKAALPHADLQGFLVVRFSLTALVMGCAALIAGAQWPGARRAAPHVIARPDAGRGLVNFKRISMFLLRHGQSYFNLHFNKTRVDPGIEDPELTAVGAEQAAAAAAQLADIALTRIIISPYTRALQTAEPILAVHRVPVDIMQEVRERTAFVCDVGSSPTVLANRFPQHEFAHLPPQWWSQTTESLEETIARAGAFRIRMAAREDCATTLVVSHWAFILALTGISARNGEILEYDPRSQAPESIAWEV
jgi:broad specificity phosphatase PhoE